MEPLECSNRVGTGCAWGAMVGVWTSKDSLLLLVLPGPARVLQAGWQALEYSPDTSYPECWDNGHKPSSPSSIFNLDFRDRAQVTFVPLTPLAATPFSQLADSSQITGLRTDCGGKGARDSVQQWPKPEHKPWAGSRKGQVLLFVPD